MAPPVARFFYDGLDPSRIKGASYPLAHGISPGVITVTVPANTPLPNLEGTAVFSFRGTTITIPGCKLDVGSSSLQEGGVWTWAIQDGRWRWQYGTITGHYNLRNQDGEIRKETEKDPQALARLCLQALKVSTYDISDIPSDPRPESHWSRMPPAQALQALADAVGCRVAVSARGFIRIARSGFGQALPEGQTVDAGFSVDTGAVPSAVLIVGGEALFQARWTLEPVGRDVDGKIKPIDELSYKPSGGWAKQTPGHFNDVAENLNTTEPDPRKLALQTIWKWYRITSMVKDSKLPGIKNATVSDYKKCLPLEDGLLDTYRDGFSKQLQRQPPSVRGTFYDGEFTYADVQDGQYRGDVSVMGEAGVIVFNKHVHRIVNGENVKADLTVEIAFPWRDDGEEPYRPTWRFNVKPRPDVGDHALPREELKFTARWKYDSQGNKTGQEDNRKKDKLDEQAQYAAQVFVAGLGNVEAGDKTYPGFLDVQPDGAIHQVTWSFSTSSPPTTHVSRNCEHDTDIFPPYAQRRKAEQVAALVKRAQRDAAGKKRDT